jgi:hypothetical protein
MQHATKTGLHRLGYGEESIRAILTQEQVEEIKRDYVLGDKQYGQTAFGKKFGVTNAAIWQIVHGNNWQTI